MKRAFVKDEGTATERYFVYIESNGQVSGGALRFSRRRDAEKVAVAINRAFAEEVAR